MNSNAECEASGESPSPRLHLIKIGTVELNGRVTFAGCRGFHASSPDLHMPRYARRKDQKSGVVIYSISNQPASFLPSYLQIYLSLLRPFSLTYCTSVYSLCETFPEILRQSGPIKHISPSSIMSQGTSLSAHEGVGLRNK